MRLKRLFKLKGGKDKGESDNYSFILEIICRGCYIGEVVRCCA